MRRGLLMLLAVLVTMVALLAACGSSTSSSSSSTATSATSTTVTAVPTRAGVDPSISAKMVCSREAQEDIAKNVGIADVLVTAPTWIDHTYSCRYVYADGTFVLSVKELDDQAQTLQYFAALGTQLGRLPDSTALGPDSFLTSNGSLVLRKDTKVLLVDVSHLPAQFGQPPAPPSQVSQAIGGAVLSCWTGA